MTSSTNNPYESPRVDAVAVESQLHSEGGAIKKGMLATISFSGWAGVLFGGMFGIGGSLMLGLSAVLGWNPLVLPSLNIFGVGTTDGTPLETGVIVVLVGAISGVACGISIGPVVGILASTHSGRFRRIAFASAIILSAIAGGAIGVLGSGVILSSHLLLGNGFVVVSQSGADVSLALATVVGAVIGSLTGLIGGLQLGRGILAFRD